MREEKLFIFEAEKNKIDLSLFGKEKDLYLLILPMLALKFIWNTTTNFES